MFLNILALCDDSVACSTDPLAPIRGPRGLRSGYVSYSDNAERGLSRFASPHGVDCLPDGIIPGPIMVAGCSCVAIWFVWSNARIGLTAVAPVQTLTTRGRTAAIRPHLNSKKSDLRHRPTAKSLTLCPRQVDPTVLAICGDGRAG
jgi:hypothetical protein